MKLQLKLILFVGIISLGCTAQGRSLIEQTHPEEDNADDLIPNGSHDLQNPSDLRFVEDNLDVPADEYIGPNTDKTVTEINSFNINRKPSEDLDLEVVEEEEVEEVEEEEEVQDYEEENIQPDESIVEKPFSEDDSSEPEAALENIPDRLPTVIIETEDEQPEADDTEPYHVEDEVHEPLIVPKTVYLLGNEEGLHTEPVTRGDVEATSPVDEPWIVPKLDPLLGLESELDRPQQKPREFSELEIELNREAERGNEARWEAEKLLDDSHLDLEELVDTSNPVRLSRPRWPVRDMNRLGVRPRHRACSQPLNMGEGPEELSSWYYSHVDGQCQWFAYRGHGGNGNRFYSRAACEGLCIFEQSHLCNNVKCSYPGSVCRLRGDELCKSYKIRWGKDVETECPPDQPVCQARRAFIAPDLDNSLVPLECFEEYDPGSCLIKTPLIKFYYNAESNSCSSFYFHGCDGNNNRFESKEDCMNHCSL